VRGIDYSQGVHRLLPGVSRLGRTPARAAQGAEGRFLWGLPGTPTLDSKDSKDSRRCQYEEHCQRSPEWGGVICDCCECCRNCRRPTCWVC